MATDVGPRRERSLRAGAAGGLVVAVFVYAWWATGLETFSTESTVAVVGAGALAIGLGTWWRLRERRKERRPRPEEPVEPIARKPGLGLWAGLLGLLTVWQMQAYWQSPREDHPTLSYLVNRALETHEARTLACGAWLIGAARLARREDR